MKPDPRNQVSALTNPEKDITRNYSAKTPRELIFTIVTMALSESVARYWAAWVFALRQERNSLYQKSIHSSHTWRCMAHSYRLQYVVTNAVDDYLLSSINNQSINKPLTRCCLSTYIVAI